MTPEFPGVALEGTQRDLQVAHTVPAVAKVRRQLRGRTTPLTFGILTPEPSMAAANPPFDVRSIRDALARQDDDAAHDRSLIVERLAWTPEQRLAANTAFLRFYFNARPSGPLLRDE